MIFCPGGVPGIQISNSQHRHCEPTGRANARPMKRSNPSGRKEGKNGLLPPSLAELRRTRSSHPPSPEGGLRRTGVLLAMTVSGALIQISNNKRGSAFSRRDAPELCVDCHPLKEQEGAGKAGCALHPRSRVQKCTKKTHTSIQVQRRHPAFPAQWFTAYSVLSPVTGLSCHRHPREACFSRT